MRHYIGFTLTILSFSLLLFTFYLQYKQRSDYLLQLQSERKELIDYSEKVLGKNVKSIRMYSNGAVIINFNEDLHDGDMVRLQDL